MKFGNAGDVFVELLQASLDGRDLERVEKPRVSVSELLGLGSDGGCWCRRPMVTSRSCRGEGTRNYLVVEVGHWLLTSTRQSGRKIRGAPDVAHFVVLVVELVVRVPLR